jgi:hypothetical protein
VTWGRGEKVSGGNLIMKTFWKPHRGVSKNYEKKMHDVENVVLYRHAFAISKSY